MVQTITDWWEQRHTNSRLKWRVTSSKTKHDVVQKNSTEVNLISPPDPPSLLRGKTRVAAIGVRKRAIDNRQVLKLSIEFLLSKGKSGNDIALFYKRFMTVLFTSTTDM